MQLDQQTSRIDSPHLPVENKLMSLSLTVSPPRVSFAEVDVYQVESFKAYTSEYWFQKEEYTEFSLDRKACVVAYRKMKSQGDPISIETGYSVIGLESALSVETKNLASERRAEIVYEVLAEQEEQWAEGYNDPDQIRLASIRCSEKPSIEAFERASSGRRDRQSAPAAYLPPPASDFEYSNFASPWGTEARSVGGCPTAPQRQMSKQMSRSKLLCTRKEASWRTTLSKPCTSATGSSDSDKQQDSRPMMPRKQPSDRQVDERAESTPRADFLPKIVRRKLSDQFQKQSLCPQQAYCVQ